MAPIQLQNGHKEYAPKTEHTLNGQSCKAICSVCDKRKPNEIVDLSANEIMKETLLTYYKMTPLQIKATLSCLCVQCVYKINAQRDMARNLELRLHQRSIISRELATQTGKTTTIITRNARAKNDSAKAKDEMSYFKKITTPCVESSQEHCHNAKTTVPEDANFYTQNATNNATIEILNANSNAAATKMSTPAHATNSTAIKDEELNLKQECAAQQAHSNTVTKVKKKADTKDVPTIDASQARSTTSTDTLQNSSMLEVICERSESAIITESGCHVNRYSASKQAQRLVCARCERSYLRKDYYKKHIRRCMQRHPYTKLSNAQRNEQPDDVAITNMAIAQDDDNHTDVTLATNAVPTRNYYCAYCDETRDNLAAIRTHQLTHLPHLECPSCGKIFNAQHCYEFHKAECNSMQETLETLKQNKELNRSDTERRRKTRSVTRTQMQEHAAVDDSFSVADSMFTQRMHTTNDWIQAQHNDEEQYCEDCIENEEPFCAELQLTSYKEYDLYLLDLFKLQVQLNYFRCFEPDCEFRSNDLFSTILHDYKEHWNRSWYFCRKCDCMFTKKVHLDYHMHLQNSGRYICFKCAQVFLFQHELDRHLIRHAKLINYRCNYCHLEYLTESELLEHCREECHNPNDERTLVSIDERMTITNNVPLPATDDQPNCAYLCHNNKNNNVRIINMCLPPMPTKRACNYPNINRHVIGDFEFKNQIIPNCAGCKYED